MNYIGSKDDISLGILVEAASDATATIMLQGFVRNDAWSWTPGNALWLDPNGSISGTQPDGIEIETQTRDAMIEICKKLDLNILEGKKGTIVEILPELFNRG